ncbi:collagen binding domain-containing protein [Kurthia senegalensis]|uniref:collagen binding domain-containing protein n=1 Tax=Kurthia senegalensis TaxID=1033740 RepID=UPI000289DED0|nr:collagen binding domain-containing protein [Kurthia senegalensis]
MKKRISIFLMAFMLMMQVLTNGFLMPMSASASEDVQTTESTEPTSTSSADVQSVNEQNATETETTDAEAVQKETEKQAAEKLAKAQQFIASLFTTDAKVDIVSTTGQPQINTAVAYIAQVEAKEQEALTKDITLVKAFVAVNQLFKPDHQTMKDGVSQTDVQAAQAATSLVDASYVQAKKVLATRIALLNKTLEEAVKEQEQAAASQATSEKKPVATTKKPALQSVAVEEQKEDAVEEATATEEKVVEVKRAKTLATEVDLADYISKITTGNYSPTKTNNVKIGDNFSLDFKLDAEKLKQLNNNTTLVYELPKGVNGQTLSGNLKSADGVVYGIVTIVDKSVKIALNEQFDAKKADLEYVEFEVKAAIGSDFTENKTSQTIEFPWGQNQSLNIPLNVEPSYKPGNATKTIVSGATGFNTKEIVYEATFNKAQKTYTNLQFKDTLPKGLAYKSIEVTEIETNIFTGKEISSTVISKTPVVTTDNGITTIGVDLGSTNKTYKFKITTSVTDSAATNIASNTAATYENSATVQSESATSGTATIGRAVALKKTGSYDATTQTMTWTVQYNFNEVAITSTEISDFFTNTSEYVTGSLKAKKVTVFNAKGEATAYEKEFSITPSATNITDAGYANRTGMKFNISSVGSTDAYVITYQTKLKSDQIVLENNKAVVDNTVISAGHAGASVSNGYKFTQGIGKKTALDIDYTNKTASWQIVLNTDATLDLTNVVVTDTFPNGGQVLDGKIEVSNDASYDLINNGTDGFVLKFTGTLPKGTTITYKTKYTERAIEDKKTLKNNANIAFNWKGTSYKVDRSAQQGLNVLATNDGQKVGTYDPKTKQFSWTLDVNYQQQEINNLTITDQLTGNHQYVAGSLKIYELNIATDGSLTNGQDVTSKFGVRNYEDAKQFKAKLTNQTNKAYRLVYNTKPSTDLIEKGQVYKNSATIADGETVLTTFGGGNGGPVTTPEVPDGSNIITKSMNQNGRALTWTIDVNKSQSTLKGSNIVVKDTPSSNQMLIKDSFKVYAYDEKTGTTSKLVETPAITFNEDGTFTLDLGKEIDRAYKVVYQTYFEGANNETATNDASISGSNFEKFETTQSVSRAVYYQELNSKIAFSGKATVKVEKFKAYQGTTPVYDGKLEGAEFVLYDETGTITFAKGTTDAEGNITFDRKLTGGKYYLAETNWSSFKENNQNEFKQFGTGYSDTRWFNNAPAIPVEISKNTVDDKNVVTVKAINYYNKEAKGCTVTFINQEGDKKLANSEYKVTDEDGNVIIETVKADQNGKIVTPKLPEGDYVLVQTKSPDGSTTTAAPKEFTVAADHCSAEAIIIEQPPKACDENPPITISKDTVVTPDKGTTVTVTPEGGKSVTGKIVENEFVPTVSFDPDDEPQLVPGKKVTIEMEGYEPITTVVPENCQDEIILTPVTSPLTCPQFDVTVKDENGKAIKNATVKVDGTSIVATTDQSGKVTFQDGDEKSIKVGTVLTVTKNGYTSITKVVGKADGTECGTSITLQKSACTQFSFTVLGPDGDPLEGAEVKIYGEEAQQTDASGHVTFKDVSVTPTTKIVVTKDGYTTIAQVIGDTEECELAVQMKEAPKVCPEFAVDVEHAPYLIGADVKVKTGSEQSVKGTVTEDGSVTFETGKELTLEPGIILEITKKGYEKQTIVIEKGAPCKLVVDLPAKPAMCEQLQVQVTDQNGKPVAGATVSTTQLTAATNTQGTATLKDTDAKEYISEGVLVTVTAEGFITTTVTLTKADLENCGTVLNVVIQEDIQACPQFTVVVNDNNGIVEGAVVSIDGTALSSTTSATGKATFESDDVTENSQVTVVTTGYGTMKATANDNCYVAVTIVPDKPVTPPKPEKNPKPDTTKKPEKKPEKETNPTKETKPTTEKTPVKETTPSKETPQKTSTMNVTVETNLKPGTSYDVYDENGKRVATNVKVKNDGTLVVSNIPKGKYTIKPHNPSNKATTLTFEVKDNDAKVVAKTLPQTGDQTLLYSLLGLVLIVLAGAVFLFKRSRKAA